MRSAFTVLASSLLLNLSAVGTKAFPGGRTRSFPAVNEDSLRSCCIKMQKDKRRIYYLMTRKDRMSLQVKGIYTSGETIFFLLLLSNHSHLDYDVDSIRFYEAGRPGRLPGRYTWHQPASPPVHTPVLVLRAVYTYGNTKQVRGKTQELSVIALPRFTLPEGRRLVIEVLERNGGRSLHLFVDNFTLVRARLI
jgi:hypothetical protein